MARITVEDCLKRVSNRFLLVNMASKRVRQIREGSEYLVSSPKNEDIVVALREIAAGLVTVSDEAVKQIEEVADTKAVKQIEEAAETEAVEAAKEEEATVEEEAVGEPEKEEDSEKEEDAEKT